MAVGCVRSAEDEGDVRAVSVVSCDRLVSLPCSLETALLPPKELCMLAMDSWLAGCDSVGGCGGWWCWWVVSAGCCIRVVVAVCARDGSGRCDWEGACV